MYHSPKQGSPREFSKQQADEDGFVFFLNSQDPRYIDYCQKNNTNQLYWFSTEHGTAVSNADNWEDENEKGMLWKLTLECTIPKRIANKNRIDVINFHSIPAEDIVIVGKIWSR